MDGYPRKREIQENRTKITLFGGKGKRTKRRRINQKRRVVEGGTSTTSDNNNCRGG